MVNVSLCKLRNFTKLIMLDSNVLNNLVITKNQKKGPLSVYLSKAF